MAQDYENPYGRRPQGGSRDDDARARRSGKDDARRAEAIRRGDERWRNRTAGRTSQRITVTERSEVPEGDRGTAYQQDLDRRHSVRRDIDDGRNRRPHVNRNDVRRSADRRASERSAPREGRRNASGARRPAASGSRNSRGSRGSRPNQVAMGPTGRRSSQSPLRGRLPLIVLVAAAVVIILILVFSIRACSAGADGQNTSGAAGTSEVEAGATGAAGAAGTTGTAGATGTTGTTGTAGTTGASRPVATGPLPTGEASRVSFVAVGDNLPDDLIGYWADAQAGEEGDGTYDYRGLYRFIKPYTIVADLAYMKEETHLGGNDIGPRGYPSFNTTDEMADAVVDAGFDFVGSASNHAYDWGLYGALENSLSVWESKPVAFTGTSVTEEQYNRIPTITRNGITFALLDYTYGVNWPDDMELPEHSINFIDEDRIASDVARAKEQADVVLVAMHWGTELLMEADEQQQHLAQFLANLDVDVVLGSHPHVIGPVAWVKNENGNGHQTLVAYSLGNFLSDHESRSPQVELEGMLRCEFVRTDSSESADGAVAGGDASATSGNSAGAIKIENVKWIPLVNHTNADRTDFAVYALKDYTNDLAKQNAAYADYDVDDPIAWLRDKTHEVIGDVVPIDDGSSKDAKDAESTAV